MEPLFEYRFTPNEAFVRGYVRYLTFLRPQSLVLIILFVVMCAGTTAAAFILRATYQIDVTTLFVCAGVCLAYLILIFVSYRTSLSLHKKRINEMYGGAYQEEVCTFREDGFTSTSGGAKEMTVAYASVTRIYETDDMLILRTKARMLHIFSKSGFVKGTPEELKRLLASKGVKCPK